MVLKKSCSFLLWEYRLHSEFPLLISSWTRVHPGFFFPFAAIVVVVGFFFFTLRI